ncbi:MAG: flagellar hook-associated protein FlgL [Alphaproteobacteria bacterium]|uniref:Flagellar hook-associated protein FlgL n=1 Tax=Candidatus Nitrobium versatile TaxID=2884831 RepID=A0A953J5U5_9BACT|nr:flagellar hook-associated protein FlgL [Candidatus Nitrobium versatile]
MRVTDRMFYDRFLSDFQRNMEAIYRANEQISSQKRVNRPSDDPAAITRIISYKNQLSVIGEYKRSIGSARDSLDPMDKALSDVNEVLIRAKELAVQGADGSSTANEREMLARNIEGLLAQAIDIANTKVGDRYIFGGYTSNTAPLDKNTGEFVGSRNTMYVDISAGVTIGVNASASELFSFRRTSSSDPSSAILPEYNWDFTGANLSTDEIYEDADPNSAVYTSVDFFLIDSTNNQIAFGTAGTGAAAAASPAMLTTGLYTGEQLAAEIQRALKGADAAGDYEVSFDDSLRKFSITNASGAARDLLWSASTANQVLGYKAEDTLKLADGLSDMSDTAVGFPATTNKFTGGGSLSLLVNDGSAAGGEGPSIVVDDTNNVIRIDGTDYTLSNGTYTGEQLAAALSSLNGGLLVSATYDSTNQKITLTPPFVVDSTNKTVTFTDGAATHTATLTEGTYTGAQLAAQVQAALDTAYGTPGSFTVAYTVAPPNNGFSITNATAGNIDFTWGAAETTAEKLLGFDSSTDTAAGGGPAISSDFAVGATTINFGNASSTLEQFLGFRSADRTIGSGITSDFAIGDVNIASDASLADVRDAINKQAGSRVKAELVNFGTTAAPDYRLVISTKPDGNSEKLEITASSTDPARTGLNSLVYKASFDTAKIDSTNNKIIINEGSLSGIATIAPGSYTADQLAIAVKEALENATASSNTYSVVYDTTINKIKITSLGPDTLDLLWADPATTAQNILGFSDEANTTGLRANYDRGDAPVPDLNVAGTDIRFRKGDDPNVYTASLTGGVYATGNTLAADVKAALEAADPSGDTYTVVYEAETGVLKIHNDEGNLPLHLLWSDPLSTAAAELGFNAADSLDIPDYARYDSSDRALTYGAQNASLGNDIANYNYITDNKNSNYYSFNNNYLNENNIVRALSFLKISLENNDAGRIEKAIDYLDKLMEKVFRLQSEVGSRVTRVETEELYQINREFDITAYLSNEQDADIAKLTTDLAQSQAALEGLRLLSSDFLRTTLFDFLR